MLKILKIIIKTLEIGVVLIASIIVLVTIGPWRHSKELKRVPSCDGKYELIIAEGYRFRGFGEFTYELFLVKNGAPIDNEFKVFKGGLNKEIRISWKSNRVLNIEYDDIVLFDFKTKAYFFDDHDSIDILLTKSDILPASNINTSIYIRNCSGEESILSRWQQ